MFSFRTVILLGALTSGVLTSVSIYAYESVFDRLDGTGPSKKRVDVIEWDGNLEIHVYPKGSVKGLGAKLDEREKGKKVIVIGYHFNGASEALVRRAILGIPFQNQIKGFVDPTLKEFDKIALSNRDLPKPWVAYPLLPAPKQWGPDGSKYDESSSPEQLTEMKRNDRPSVRSRAPASIKAVESVKVYVHPSQRRSQSPKKPEHDDGGVQEYQW